ncbi:retrovirus-related pol polyprotein from transposon TNT 1-94 [Tanacetum coccineum]
MSTLKFAETHNLVTLWEKPEERNRFEEIVDFLNASSIRYALTVNPTIYTSCIKQLWATVKWKFFIYTIPQCLSAKTTSWNEFSSTMASAIIYLATNQIFNFSKYVFDNMVKNLEGGVKFLMYLRFVQVFLDKQVEHMCKHKEIYVTPSHTKKIFANIKREGKGFSGRITPLFQTMMVQAPEEVGEGSAVPTDSHHTTTQPSTSRPQKKQSRRKQRKDSGPTEPITDEDTNEEHVAFDLLRDALSAIFGLSELKSLTLQDVLSSLNSWESKKTTDANDDGDGLYVRGRLDHQDNQGRGSSRSKSKGKGTYKLKCYICYFEDHLKKDCPKRNKKKSTSFVKNNAGQGSVMHFEGYVSGGLSDGLVVMVFAGCDDNKACAIIGTRKMRVQMKDGSSFMLENNERVKVIKGSLMLLSITMKQNCVYSLDGWAKSDQEGYTVKLQNGRVKVIKGSLMVLSITLKQNYVYSLDGWAKSGEASVGIQENESLAQVCHKRLGTLVKQACMNWKEEM